MRLWSLCALLVLACAVPRAELPVADIAVQQVTVTVGPFDIHRRYRSMEGPYVMETLRISDLVEQKATVLGEPRVKYVEGGTFASMNGAAASPAPACSPRPRKLYWLRSIKLEVLDEAGRPLPTAEFICHMNLDVDPAFRNRVFEEGERCTQARILTLTQGQTEVRFPEGFGVPVASDEQWTWTFQAANRTTDEHRRLQHRMTMELIEDQDLLEPVQALAWMTPFLSVVVDKNSPEARARELKEMPGCLPTTVGLTAPNSVPGTNFDSWCGQRRTGHWVVAPGRHTYQSAIPELRMPEDRTLRLVWSHVHPLLETASILECAGKKPLLTVRARTRTKPGIELEAIELLTFPEGLTLKADTNYAIESVYHNTTRAGQDSMVSLGLFYDDHQFARPAWVLANQNEDVNCAVLPLYDGPLLQAPRKLTLETSRGPLRIVLDPELAPQTASQVARLLEEGVYDETPFVRYEPGFVLQLGNAKQDTSPLLRRLPVEPSGRKHAKGLLSMARYEDPDSAVSSFSIMLGPAPHLDGQYTVFGWVETDPASQATLEALTKNFQPDKEVLRGVR